MAMYYGPPNFKAYDRRGLALAHLKRWKKAILGELVAVLFSHSPSSLSLIELTPQDFERALEIEPGNAVVIEQMKLARMRRS